MRILKLYCLLYVLLAVVVADVCLCVVTWGSDSGSRSLESEVDSEIQVDTRPVTPMMLACSSSRASLPTMSPPMTPRYVNSRTLDRHRPGPADRLISSIVRSLHFADTFISDGQLTFCHPGCLYLGVILLLSAS